MQTILVIDDDESLRDTIGIMLEQEGFTPVLVADGKAGFERALSLKPDLMIVDLRLPGMSGTEICKQQDADHRAERGGGGSGQGAAAGDRR
jgi:DNA-binding response OmpR family regulator